MALSIVSLNVNGLSESSKREGLLQWLQSLAVTVDVVSLQETHCTSDVECHSWFSFSGFSFVLSPGTCRSGGCIVLYRPILTLVNYWCEVPGRSLICEFSFHDATFRVHWSLIRDGFTENFKNDLLWLIILRVVKVRGSMKNWGYIDSDRCACCSRKETIDHCFLNCSRVKAVWSHISPILTSLLRMTFLSNCLSVFFFQWPRVDAKNARLARFLVKTILYGIWKFIYLFIFFNLHFAI